MFVTFRDSGCAASGHTAMGGRLPPGDPRVQQLQRRLLDRRRRRGKVEPLPAPPGGLDPVHREGSEMPEQAPEVVDGLAGARSALATGDSRTGPSSSSNSSEASAFCMCIST